MFGRVPGTRPNISESHSEISTRVPFCIAESCLPACLGSDTLTIMSGGLEIMNGDVLLGNADVTTDGGSSSPLHS